ncbi:MAG: FkbM family methyltransferase [Gemmatimonadota bacterium]
MTVPTRAERFEAFLDRVRHDVYPEPPSAQHSAITRQAWAKVQALAALPPGSSVLDVGCGQGVALELFRDAGLRAVGITIGEEDLAACRALGFDVRDMDQSFLDFPDGSFRLVWCRHALEHSVAPYLTLSEFHRVLEPGGILYVEVPAPETACHHERNPNHYSVLGQAAWRALFHRAGFAPREELQISLETPAGPDLYWGFVLVRQDGPGTPSAASHPAARGDDGWAEIDLRFETPAGLRGITLRLDRGQYTQAIMAEALARGDFYEPEVSHFLISVLRPGDTVIDVGAHVGYFSLLAAAVVGEAGRVFSFEPEQGNFTRLVQQVAENGFTNVEAMNAAVGADAARGELRVCRDNDGGHALWDVGAHPFNARTREHPETQAVDIVTLDGMFERFRGRQVRLVKVDAEGAEKDVLRGGMMTLQALGVPYVVCEVNEYALQRMGTSSVALRALMEAFGYRCYRLSATPPHFVRVAPDEPLPGDYVCNVVFTTEQLAGGH